MKSMFSYTSVKSNIVYIYFLRFFFAKLVLCGRQNRQFLNFNCKSYLSGSKKMLAVMRPNCWPCYNFNNLAITEKNNAKVSPQA